MSPAPRWCGDVDRSSLCSFSPEQRVVATVGGQIARDRGGVVQDAPKDWGCTEPHPCREGERWYRLRQVLNKRLLKPSEAVLYADAIGEVVSDLMVRLRDERSRSPSGVLVGDVANLLYRFALEGRGASALLRSPHPRGALDAACPPQGSPISFSRPALGA